MSLSDLFVSTAILDDSRSLDKKEVIHRLLLKLAADGHLDQASVPSVLDGVMRRESLASTGIGRGIAVPHTKHPAINRRLGILGLCRPPVDFDSIDAEPVDLVFLILAPPDSPGYQSMRVPRDVEELHRRMRNETFCNKLRESTSAEELREILLQSELADSCLERHLIGSSTSIGSDIREIVTQAG